MTADEQEAIRCAFQAQVQALFKTLCANLTGSFCPDDDKDCLDRFNAGLELARKAYSMTTGVTA